MGLIKSILHLSKGVKAHMGLSNIATKFACRGRVPKVDRKFLRGMLKKRSMFKVGGVY
jgi:hypothetical protein